MRVAPSNNSHQNQSVRDSNPVSNGSQSNVQFMAESKFSQGFNMKQIKEEEKFQKDDSIKLENQHNQNEQKIESLTNHHCWLCGEEENDGDPFVCVCKCAGSNCIHASCLIKVVLDNIKKSKQKNLLFRQKKNFQMDCSICKFAFNVEMFFKYRFDFKVSKRNSCRLIVAFLLLLSSIGFGIICQYPFEIKGSYKNSVDTILNVLAIILFIICVILVVCSILSTLYFVLSAFLIEHNFKIQITSNLKDKNLKYFYDLKEEKFVYYNPTQKNSQVVVQQHNVSSKHPNHNLTQTFKTKRSKMNEDRIKTQSERKKDQEQILNQSIQQSNNLNISNVNHIDNSINQLNITNDLSVLQISTIDQTSKLPDNNINNNNNNNDSNL